MKINYFKIKKSTSPTTTTKNKLKDNRPEVKYLHKIEITCKNLNKLVCLMYI